MDPITTIANKYRYTYNRKSCRGKRRGLSWFDETIFLEVGAKESCVYLQPVSVRSSIGRSICLWYKKDGQWRRAEWTERGICIPTEIFVFTASGGESLTEGEGMIAMTERDIVPKEEACRELTIFLW